MYGFLKLKDWLNYAPKAMQFTAMFLAVFILLPIATSQAETRKLKLHFLHTGEKAEIAYKKNGRYIASGLKKVNRFLRDWRRNEPTKMDPRLLDLIWEVYRETGSRNHIKVISGYRSPKTNSLLRKRGRGVAKKSQHTLGKALDFFIPGVKLSKLRAIGLRKGLGGVGYYPRSGSPFVHMDTGRVRHWPRMSRKELVRVFPKGKTLHVPTDGKPLPRYNQAKAEYERKLKGKTRIASAEQIRKKPSIIDKLFNRGGEDDGVQTSKSIAKKSIKAPTAPKPAPTPSVTPASAPTLATGVPLPAKAKPTTRTGVPTPQAPIPGIDVDTSTTAEPAPVVETPETIIASLAPPQLPVPQFSPRVLIASANQAETVTQATTQETDLEPLANSEETGDTQLALVIPVPTRSPNLAENSTPASASTVIIANVESDTFVDEPVIQNVQEEDFQLQPVLEVAALSPTEIEDLRNQFHREISSGANEPKANDIKLLSALSDYKPKTDGSTTASDAIDAQLSGFPIAKKSQDIIIEASIQSPEPSQAEPAKIAIANIPVPVRSPITHSTSKTVVVEKPAQQPNPDSSSKPNSKEPVSVEERMIGQWAFATDTSIQTISKIEPIDYKENIFKNLPSTLETTGFSILNQNRNAGSFN